MPLIEESEEVNQKLDWVFGAICVLTIIYMAIALTIGIIGRKHPEVFSIGNRDTTSVSKNDGGLGTVPTHK